MHMVDDDHCFNYETRAALQNNMAEGSAPNEELRCVLAVVRHGDRTPKQKMKLRVNHPQLLLLMMRHMDAKGKQAKLKSVEQLQELLDIVRNLHGEYIHLQLSVKTVPPLHTPCIDASCLHGCSLATFILICFISPVYGTATV